MTLENIIKSFNFENKQLRFYGTAEDPWFCGKDVAIILRYKKPLNALQDKVKNKNKVKYKNLYNKNLGTGLLIKGNQANLIFINKDGLYELILTCRLPNKEKFITFCKCNFNINIEIFNSILYKEQEIIGNIIKVFNYKDYKTQYCIGKYRIDLYFLKEKLAIECDEFGHKDRCPQYEKEREIFIKNTLNCNFIRFNPDADDFDIFILIKEICMYFDN